MSANSESGSAFRPKWLVPFFFYLLVVYVWGVVSVLIAGLALRHQVPMPKDWGALFAGAIGWAFGLTMTKRGFIKPTLSRTIAVSAIYWLCVFLTTWEWRQLWPSFPAHELVLHAGIASMATALVAIFVMPAQSYLMRKYV